MLSPCNPHIASKDTTLAVQNIHRNFPSLQRRCSMGPYRRNVRAFYIRVVKAVICDLPYLTATQWNLLLNAEQASLPCLFPGFACILCRCPLARVQIFPFEREPEARASAKSIVNNKRRPQKYQLKRDIVSDSSLFPIAPEVAMTEPPMVLYIDPQSSVTSTFTIPGSHAPYKPP